MFTNEAMIKTRNQHRFRKFHLNEAKMNRHRHYGDRTAKRVVVFVHGLNGNGYKTWKRLPKYLFNDLSHAPIDVAIFDYFSGFRRRICERPAVPVIAEILTERLQELSSDYDEIYIVAHSMGGLIAKDAISKYIEQCDEEPGLLRTLSGAILIATPLNGSKLAQAAFQVLVTEVRQLRPDSDYQQKISRYFNDNIDSKNNSKISERHHYKLPIWAFVGSKDWIVRRASSTFDIVDGQTRTLSRGHSRIVKPCISRSPVVTWAHDVIDGISKLRADIRNPGATAQPPTPDHLVLAEFLLEIDANDAWQPIYESVIESPFSQLVSVKDRYDSGLAYRPNLLISAHRSEDLIGRRDITKQKLDELKDKYDAGHAHARAISVGPSHNRKMSMDALSALTKVGHQDNQEYRLVFGSAENDRELETRLSDYIREVVRKQHSNMLHRDAPLPAEQPFQITTDREGE
jgi:pimeloyl-ACP methyl ester carboxylesterase